jgi:hypothetical protein
MKLRPNSTQPRIFDGGYEHPWYKYKIAKDCPEDMRKPVYNLLLNKPNPPSQEAIEKAKFVDKTFHWSGSDSVRSGNKRSSK